MNKLVKIGGCLLFIGALATVGCGGTEMPPDDQTGTETLEALTPLHHNSPVYEEVDELVPDTHDEAIDDVVETLAEIDETVNQVDDMTASSSAEM